jgi:membrane-bound lytic murein transglycosylase F
MVGSKHFNILAAILVVLFVSCRHKEVAPNPWGVTDADMISSDSSSVKLDDIISNGEMIMVTMSGPDTYYEYHGRGMGLHYLLCEKFCQSIGVSLRVDVCKDTLDMIRRVENGEADIVAMPIKKNINKLLACAEKGFGNKCHWLVNETNKALADALDSWLTADLVKKTTEEQAFWLSSRSITRHVYSPIQNRSAGVISDYDHLFRRYAPVARWDWRLLAAQCYQESTFDPRARSWAGAAGLMQIMPSTADHLGLPRTELYNPEQNIAAATRYIAQLTRKFSDVSNPSERIKFVLASYNGGAHHVRDAMALARKHGVSPYHWNDVRGFILRLSQSDFYNDPVVKYGYMRGSETVDYVDRIWSRWYNYRGIKHSGGYSPGITTPSSGDLVPKPHPSARRKTKYNI